MKALVSLLSSKIKYSTFKPEIGKEIECFTWGNLHLSITKKPFHTHIWCGDGIFTFQLRLKPFMITLFATEYRTGPTI